MLSNGTPMFCAGDEFLHPQGGNNNPYNQDNETTWLDWERLETNADVFRFFRLMIAFRKAHPALRSGTTIFRGGTEGAGLLAFSRVLDGREVLVALNTSAQSIEQNVIVETSSTRFTTLAGSCPSTVTAPGTARVTLPPFGYAICDVGN
jgi:pullulanase/glycogen debranching enzyme